MDVKHCNMIEQKCIDQMYVRYFTNVLLSRGLFPFCVLAMAAAFRSIAYRIRENV